MPDDYVKRSEVHKVFQLKYAPAINRTFAAMINSIPAAEVVSKAQYDELLKAAKRMHGMLLSDTYFPSGRIRPCW